jgi:uncharacterized protein YdcH (DUF465 family)
MSKTKNSKSKNKSSSSPLEFLNVLNDNKYFAGIIMLVMNIGSKYITIELSKTQEAYFRYTLGRQIIIFSILWAGTRDITISLVLTAVFILLVDYLFNENSKFCIIPEKYKELQKEVGGNMVTQKEVNEAIDTLKKARKQKDAGGPETPEFLYKENFI